MITKKVDPSLTGEGINTQQQQGFFLLVMKHATHGKAMLKLLLTEHKRRTSSAGIVFLYDFRSIISSCMGLQKIGIFFVL